MRNRKGSLDALSLEKLRDLYAEAAMLHAEAMESGNFKLTNKQYDAVDAIWDELRRRGTAGQQIILELMLHDSVGVRCWSACHALGFAPERAVPVLEQIAAIPTGMMSLDAETALKRWRAGELRFD